MNYTEAFLSEVRAEMGRRRMTVRDLANTLGWPYEALIRRMNGTVKLDLEAACTIAVALGLDMPAFGTGSAA